MARAAPALVVQVLVGEEVVVVAPRVEPVDQVEVGVELVREPAAGITYCGRRFVIGRRREVSPTPLPSVCTSYRLRRRCSSE